MKLDGKFLFLKREVGEFLFLVISDGIIREWGLGKIGVDWEIGNKFLGDYYYIMIFVIIIIKNF